jgi:hypothetical protein
MGPRKEARTVVEYDCEPVITGLTGIAANFDRRTHEAPHQSESMLWRREEKVEERRLRRRSRQVVCVDVAEGTIIPQSVSRFARSLLDEAICDQVSQLSRSGRD